MDAQRSVKSKKSRLVGPIVSEKYASAVTKGSKISVQECYIVFLLKFMFSKKATKFDKIFTVDLCYVKDSKSRKQIMVSSILPKNKGNSLS